MALTAREEKFVKDLYSNFDIKKQIRQKNIEMRAEIDGIMGDDDYAKKRRQIKINYRSQIQALKEQLIDL